MDIRILLHLKLLFYNFIPKENNFVQFCEKNCEFQTQDLTIETHRAGFSMKRNKETKFQRKRVYMK